jgi:hypothetical protein
VPTTNAIIGCRLGLSSFDPALFCAAPMPNQKGRLPITDTSLPKMDFGAHGPHDFRAVVILDHVGPEQNPAARCHMNNSIGQQAAPATNIYREGRGCSRNRYHRDYQLTVLSSSSAR